MSTASPSHRAGTTRRNMLRAGVGAGVGVGVGLAVGTGLLADAASAAAVTGASLCDQPGDSASRFGLGSGDLAIPYYRAHDNDWGYVFGDSWGGIQ